MKPYKIKKSKIDNLGLYAAKNIKKGTRVIEYKGKVITIKETEKNPKYDNGKAIYLFNLNKRLHKKVKNTTQEQYVLVLT